MRNSEQVAVSSEQRRKLLVLPRVWAVAKKKPCGSVEAFAGIGKAYTGVSPLRPVRLAPLAQSASDEMTVVEGTSAAALGEPPTLETTNDAVVARPAEVNAGSVVVELAFYRKYTEAMLHRYAVMSLESGRVPSMLGREMFRGRVTNYRVRGFDDVVIFCHDVESCLKRLSPEEQKYIKRIAIQQYTHSEAANMLGVCLRTCVTQYANAIDRLTRRFLEVKLLEPLKTCQ